MKKSILLILFVCSLTFSALGETKKDHNTTHPLIEFFKKYNFAKGVTKQSMFKLNESFTLDAIEYQGWNGSEFVSSSRTDFIYQLGNRTETRYYNKSDAGAEWQMQFLDLYVFTDNRLTSLTEQIVNGDEYINDYRSMYTYQQSGVDVFLDEAVDQYWNTVTSDWENEERTVFTVSDGEITGGESGTWGGSEWIPYERFIFEEQESGLYLTYQEFTGTEWVNSERQIYENFTINELYLLFSEEFNFLETGTYLEIAELLPDFTQQLWQENEWIDDFRQITEMEYVIETGEIAGKVITWQIFESVWITFNEVSVTYQSGKPLELVVKSIDESETLALVSVYAEEFVYDEQGQLKYAIEKSLATEIYKTTGGTDLLVVGRNVFEWSGASTSIEDPTAPVSFSLGNAYPNPFNPSTVIPFQLSATGDISIRVFDMLGREVGLLVNRMFSAGNHTVRFDASGLSSGIYLVRLDAPGYQQTRRVTLLK